MGSMQAAGWADAAASGLCDLRTAVLGHLTSNMFPPKGEMLNTAMRAISKAKRGQWDATVRLPDGVRFRDGTERGSALAPVEEVIRSLHLEFFLPPSEEEG